MNAGLNSLLGWASSQGAAQKLQNQITRAAGLSDDVRGVYARMGDESMKFNTMLVEAMVRQIPALGIAKKDINRFNADVRKSVPDFAGVETEEGLAQMKGLAPASKKGGKPVSPSDLRKLVVNKMDMKNDYGKVGFPSYEDTLRAITEPELRGLPRGESGFSTIKAFPGSALLDDAMHDTYSHGVKGIYGGGLEESVPYQVMFPDLYRATADLRVTQKNSARLGQPLNETERTGAVLLGGGAQKADQQWLDGVMTYLENKKKLVGLLRSRLPCQLVTQTRYRQKTWTYKTKLMRAVLAAESIAATTRQAACCSKRHKAKSYRVLQKQGRALYLDCWAALTRSCRAWPHQIHGPRSRLRRATSIRWIPSSRTNNYRQLKIPTQ